MKKSGFFQKIMQSHAAHWALISLLMIAAVYVLQAYGPMLQASLISLPHHAPFDGLVFPVVKSPDWVNVSNTERDLPYSQLPQEKLVGLPAYEPSYFLVPFEQLKWGTQTDNVIRNTKITYSVPYLGNYKLNNAEGAGSHPAIDIKIPSGTPVFAIANGVVVKVSMNSSGFGMHVVLRHDDFPSMEDENSKATYFSSYNHLSSILVSEGTVVTKGQQIALSGSSGTSTTPHLHFQIDKADAPFHPYWPFTSKDAQDAGVSFFDAINTGVGRGNAQMYTINPMQYIKKYQYKAVVIAQAPAAEVNVPSVETPVVEIPAPVPVLETPQEPIQPEAEITPQAVEQPQAEIQPETLPQVTEEPQAPDAEVIPEVAPAALFTDVSLTDPDYQAFEYLYGKGILKGYSDGSLQPDRSVLRVEAVKMILAGIGYEISEDAGSKTLFSDLADGSWYIPYISAAYREGFAKGNPDGTFRPVNQVNIAEFYKMLFLAMELDLNPNVTSTLPQGVDPAAWYAPYIQEALLKNILDLVPGQALDVSKPMTRREIARAMYKVNIIIETGVSAYTP